MLEVSSIVKIGVSLYFVLGSFVVYTLYQYSNAQDSLQNTGIILAGLLPAFIAILPYWKQASLENHSSITIFFDESIRGPIMPGWKSSYSDSYFELFSNLNQNSFIMERLENEVDENNTQINYWWRFQNEDGFDLAERLVLQKLASKFMGHWNIQFRSSKTARGKTTRASFGKSKKLKLQFNQLRDKFKHNSIVDTQWHSFSPPFLTVPPETKLEIENDEWKRIIRFKLDESAEIEIVLLKSSAGIAPNGIWGLLNPNPNLALIDYDLNIKLKYYKHRNKSESYERWFNNISDALGELDWEQIDLKTEENIKRRILEQFSP